MYIYTAFVMKYKIYRSFENQHDACNFMFSYETHFKSMRPIVSDNVHETSFNSPF